MHEFVTYRVGTNEGGTGGGACRSWSGDRTMSAYDWLEYCREYNSGPSDCIWMVPVWEKYLTVAGDWPDEVYALIDALVPEGRHEDAMEGDLDSWDGL